MFLNKIDTSSQYPVISPLIGEESPISILPQDVLAKIFSHTDCAALSRGSQVSKNCDAVINGKPSENDPLVKERLEDPLLQKKVIYHTKVFGNKQWALCGGEQIVKDENMDEEFQSFSAFTDRLMKCKPFVGKKMSDVLDAVVFVRIPKDLTTDIIGKLAKPYFPKGKWDGYAFFMPMDKKYKSMEKSSYSYWVCMTKKAISDSGYKPYPVQQQMAADLGYEVPKVLEAIACLFATHCFSGTRSYEDIWTRCLDKIQGYQAVVGLAPAGLVANSYHDDVDSLGVAGLLRSGPAEVPVIGPR